MSTNRNLNSGAGPAGAELAGERPPASVEEALARARSHGRAAATEALAAVRALLDAASLAASGEPSETHRLLAPLAKLVDALSERLAGEADSRAASILHALAEALDVEIERWEARARDDAEARAVLRAFLGLRELLWELGVRQREPEAPARGESARARAAPGSRRGPAKPGKGRRIQRLSVQG